MRVLCVAEKPSVAKQMVDLLGGGAAKRTLKSYSQYNRVTEFQYTPGVPHLPSTITLVVTSVAGHLMNTQFSEEYQSWDRTQLDGLIRAPIQKVTSSDKRDIVRTLKEHSKDVDALWLWLDCDREGENIAAEVRSICLSSNKKLIVKRAVFSALTLPQVETAIRTLRDLDELAAAAVDTRQEVDLRYGIVFSRFQTLLVRSKYNVSILSYGPCQIPTLQLIVDRYLRYYTFQSTPFWYIEVLITPESTSSQVSAEIADQLRDFQEDDGDEHENDDSTAHLTKPTKRRRSTASTTSTRGTGSNTTTTRGPAITPTIFHWKRKRLYEETATEAILSTLVEPAAGNVAKFNAFFNQQQQQSTRSTPGANTVPPPSFQQLLSQVGGQTTSRTPTPDARLTAKPKPFTVVSLDEYPTSKWRPVPLTTITFQQHACRKLGLTALEAMNIAEKLYQNGFISYPRTETDKFPPEMDLRSIVSKFAQDQSPSSPGTVLAPSVYSQYAAELLEQNKLTWPRAGKHDDQAHPPIHPLKPATTLSSIGEMKVYDFIVRQFLGVCSPDARGVRIKATLQCGSELFSGEGLTVTERNYLEICNWEYWSNKTIPQLQLGGTVYPAVVRIRNGKTSGPPLHTESSLLAAMYKHSIGTDATMASHINTIRQRGYVFQNTVLPTPLGCAMALAYRYLCRDAVDVSKRAVTEKETDSVAKGLIKPEEMVNRNITQLEGMYAAVSKPYSQNILLHALGLALDSEVQQHVMTTLGSSGSTSKRKSTGSTGTASGTRGRRPSAAKGRQ